MTSARHLSPDGFARYLAAGVPLESPIDGTPKLILFIAPSIPEIGLRIPVRGDEKIEDPGLAHFRVRAPRHRDRGRVELVVTNAGLFQPAYQLLTMVADRIQLDGLGPANALAETVARVKDLLRTQDALSQERELGLFGELLMLRALAARTDPASALTAWRGPEEEHDFGLHGIDIEVKTTSTERRLHWIGSLTQLVPTGDRPLWLVSYQLTRAEENDGRTLAELIELVRSRFSGAGYGARFDSCLKAHGWRDAHTAANRTRWRLRTRPLAFRVTPSLPRLTPDLLDLSGIDRSRIPDVRYRVDLSGLSADREPPEILKNALGEEM